MKLLGIILALAVLSGCDRVAYEAKHSAPVKFYNDMNRLPVEAVVENCINDLSKRSFEDCMNRGGYTSSRDLDKGPWVPK